MVFASLFERHFLGVSAPLQRPGRYISNSGLKVVFDSTIELLPFPEFLTVASSIRSTAAAADKSLKGRFVLRLSLINANCNSSRTG
jgi:hypothetical protein